ncbi:MAG: DUF262 domain-containing HNH endonuclease family protein [Prevotellaceae bacterium]|nr:DUF262 domain-containing HNH endonuclease family protein [Prevotellaceae bacterium]
MAKEIEPKLQTIGAYLKKTEVFRIPEYQRAYSWNVSNCDKLWQDIEAYIAQDAEDPYFFGTIIIDCSSENYLNLIDGQQRTTTFLLLLKAMHLRIIEVLNTMAKTEEAEWLRESLQESLNFIYEILYRADARKRYEIKNDWGKAKGIKILENESINELYKDELKNIIESSTFADAEKAVHKIPRKQKDNKYTNFFRNFKSFYEKLVTYQESNLYVLVNGFLNKCQIIEIKSWQIEQAITMFNSLNSTGMSLSDADIISAGLFYHAKDTKFKDIWEPIIRQADELGQKRIVNIDNVLQQYMYINRAKNHQYAEGELNTPGVRKYYIVHYPSLLEKPIELCDRFQTILSIWNKIQSYPITKLLLKFNENFKLFLISYLFRVSEDELSEHNITPIMECFLRLFAILELSDYGFSSKYFKSFLFNENFKLVDADYSLESIISDFNSHISSNWNRKDLMDNIKEYDKNILVYLNEYIYAKEHGLPFDFDPDKVNVEHIMPASGHNIDTIRTDAEMSKEEFEDMVNLLGNKILLEEDINKHIGMDWFKTKKGTLVQDKKGYIGSKFGLAKYLSSYPSDKWGKEDIETANNKAAERICRFIFNIQKRDV